MKHSHDLNKTLTTMNLTNETFAPKCGAAAAATAPVTAVTAVATFRLYQARGHAHNNWWLDNDFGFHSLSGTSWTSDTIGGRWSGAAITHARARLPLPLPTNIGDGVFAISRRRCHRQCPERDSCRARLVVNIIINSTKKKIFFFIFTHSFSLSLYLDLNTSKRFVDWKRRVTCV